MDFSYIVNKLGENFEDYTGAISPPIYQTSNFCFKDVDGLRHAFADERGTSIYTRGNNPTTTMLCKKLAALDEAGDTLVFSSGIAAISAAVISQLKAGDHVICVRSPYSWTQRLLNDILGRYGVETTYIDGTDMSEMYDAVKHNTAMIYLESPNSLTFELQDVEAVAVYAKQSNIITVMDNSYASPLNPSPLTMGIDIIVYSGSKYLGGHSDMVCGVLSSSDAIIDSIFKHEFMNLGGIVSPHSAWLLIRSLRTLPIRMERIGRSCRKVVEYLDAHEMVESVIYPLWHTHPQYELAKKQMTKDTGLFSIKVKTSDPEKIEAFCNNLKHFLLACSWGGYESLILPIIAFGDYNQKGELPANLIRIYVGLEDTEVLIADLDQAFEKMTA